ncbi:MAG: CGNR zinc finger domain-containing protein [Oryzihumus sp.]
MSGTRPLVLLDVCGDPVELLVDFLNTLDVDEGTDVLSSAESWQAWLEAHELGCFDAATGEAELVQARQLRDDLRARAAGEPCAQVRLVGILVALCGHGLVEISAVSPVGFLAAAAATVAIEQRLDRVKICPADDCRWAFYDISRNRSRQWCSMEVCGNRAKARAHRERLATRDTA